MLQVCISNPPMVKKKKKRREGISKGCKDDVVGTLFGQLKSIRHIK